MGPWRVVPTRKPHPTPSAPWRATLRLRHAIANKPATHGHSANLLTGPDPRRPRPSTDAGRPVWNSAPATPRPAPPPGATCSAPGPEGAANQTPSRLQRQKQVPAPAHDTACVTRGCRRPHTPTPFSRTFVATVQGQGHAGKRPSRPCPSTTKMGHAAGPVSAHAALGDPDLAASRGGVRVVCPVPGRANAMRKTQPRRCPQGTDGAEPGPAATQLPTADPAPTPEKDKYRATSLKKRDLRTG